MSRSFTTFLGELLVEGFWKNQKNVSFAHVGHEKSCLLESNHDAHRMTMRVYWRHWASFSVIFLLETQKNGNFKKIRIFFDKKFFWQLTVSIASDVNRNTTKNCMKIAGFCCPLGLMSSEICGRNFPTRSEVALRYFPSKRRRNDGLNEQQLIVKVKLSFEWKKVVGGDRDGWI